MKCPKCQIEHTKVLRFCNGCGTKLEAEPQENYLVSVNKAKVFFFFLLGYIGLLHLANFRDFPIDPFLADGVLAVIIIVFLAIDFTELKSVVIPKINDLRTLGVLIISMIILAYLVHIFSGYLNHDLFDVENGNYYENYSNTSSPLLLCIISTAVFPAIFEELAFRGILFSELLKIMPIRPTIIITSFLFTILHFSFISLLWIFPLGFLFGYLRHKYNNIIYGVISHFIYNSSVVLIEYFGL